MGHSEVECKRPHAENRKRKDRTTAFLIQKERGRGLRAFDFAV